MQKGWLHDKRLWAIYAAALARMGFYGFWYFPQLDDYIQYGVYPLIEQPFSQVYAALGLYATRPLAGLFDIFVWGRLWQHMGVVLFVMTVLHAASAYLLLQTADRLQLPLGMLFVVVFLLCPLNFEATYWVSASSRLVVSVFLMSLSLHLQMRGNKSGFLCVQLLSLLFYEQTMAVSLLLSVLVAWRQKDKHAFWGSVSNGAMVVGYYLLFAKTGPFAARATWQWWNKDAIAAILKSWSVHWYPNALRHGISVATVGYLVGTALIALCFWQRRGKAKKELMLAGGLVFLFGYAPFFVLQNTVVALRSAFVPLIGLAMVLDAVCCPLPGRGAITVALAISFLWIAPGELSDYRQSYLADRQMIERIASETKAGVPNVIVGAKRYNIPSNFDFEQHIMGITSSDWAITGAVRQHTGQFRLPYYRMDTEGLEEFHSISIEGFSF